MGRGFIQLCLGYLQQWDGFRVVFNTMTDRWNRSQLLLTSPGENSSVSVGEGARLCEEGSVENHHAQEVNKKGMKSLEVLVGGFGAEFPRTFSSQDLPQPASNQPGMIPFSTQICSFSSKYPCSVLRSGCSLTPYTCGN